MTGTVCLPSVILNSSAPSASCVSLPCSTSPPTRMLWLGFGTPFATMSDGDWKNATVSCSAMTARPRAPATSTAAAPINQSLCERLRMGRRLLSKSGHYIYALFQAPATRWREQQSLIGGNSARRLFWRGGLGIDAEHFPQRGKHLALIAVLR